jgi:hypothetical protein
MAIVTYPLNGVEYTAENAETYFCTRTSGVYAAEDNFALSIVGAFEMSIGTGLAWIKDGTFSGKSVVSTEEVAIQVPIADGVLNRKDRIVLRFDKSANASSIVLKVGTPATNAEPPSIVRDGTAYELGLYVINVPAASTAVQIKNITSTMLDESVCGIMRDAVTGIPTATLQAQVEALLAEIEATLKETVASNIPNHAAQHAKNGKDPITPDSIGAASKEYVEQLIGSAIGGGY